MEKYSPIHISHLKTIKFYSLKKLVDSSLQLAIIDYNKICDKEYILSRIECKRLFIHFLTKAICDLIIENNEYTAFLIFNNISLDIVKIIKKIQKHIPVFIEMTNLQESEVMVGHYQEYTSKFFQWNLNKQFSFENTQKFCIRYKLNFLTNHYFSSLTQKQLLV